MTKRHDISMEYLETSEAKARIYRVLAEAARICPNRDETPVQAERRANDYERQAEWLEAMKFRL